MGNFFEISHVIVYHISYHFNINLINNKNLFCKCRTGFKLLRLFVLSLRLNA